MKSGTLIPPASFFFLRIALTIQDLYIQKKKIVVEIDKPLARLIKEKKKDRTQINKIRNEKVKVKMDFTEIQRMIRDYYKKLYTNKMGNLE